MARRSIRVKPSPRRAAATKPRGAKPAGLTLEAVLDLPVVGQQLAIEHGLPFAAVVRLRELLGIPLDELAARMAIPGRTLARRKSEGVLDPLESDRLLRIARLFVLARGLFDGDAKTAREWLNAPQRALGAKTPLEFASTEVGAREVEALVGRLAHGVFT